MLSFRGLLYSCAAALACFSFLASTDRASAAFQLTLTTTAGVYIIDDGGAGDLDGSANGTISIFKSDAAYNVVGSISLSNSPGLYTNAILDASFTVSAATGTGGAASLVVSSTGYTQPTLNPLTLTSSLNGNGTGAGTISGQSYADTTDTLYGIGGPTSGLQGPFSTDPNYNSVASTQFNQTGNFSLTTRISFNLAAGSTMSGDILAKVTPAPAPQGLFLALSGLPAIGLWIRQRRLRAVSA